MFYKYLFPAKGRYKLAVGFVAQGGHIYVIMMNRNCIVNELITDSINLAHFTNFITIKTYK